MSTEGAAEGPSTPEPEEAAEETGSVSEIERLRAELTEARERADRYHSNWQRSAADFQNWKRRADQERAELTRLAEGAMCAELLRVLDDFERAFQAFPPELRTLTWVEGVAMIGQKLFAILQGRGLSPIEALGQDFDPHVHEAVLHEEEGDLSEQTSIVAELQRGYRFHDRVIRATLVKVGKPPEPAASSDQPPAEEGEAAAGDEAMS
ncbi:MAG: nucleotide exchange factor GrpE [Chloroflexi bacterium]|nr:nucleotide exchange factor GrpE [Chloroflexota bacterium]